MKKVIMLLVFTCSSMLLSAQESEAASGTPSEGTTGTGQTESGSEAESESVEEHIPEPYADDEFVLPLQDIRRFEIITLGSFPITAILSYLVYGLVRYAVHGFAVDYAPIGSATTVPYTLEENLGVMAVAGSSAIVIAVIDFIIGVARREEQ